MKLKDSAISIVFTQQVAALIFALSLMLTKFGLTTLPITALSPFNIFEAAVGGIAYYGLAFYFYVLGLRMTTAVHAGTYLTLIPVFGLVFSFFLLGERISSQAFLGALIVIGAVGYLALVDRSRSIKT
jgi:drug/metabolite transporter (DMT)-like permease